MKEERSAAGSRYADAYRENILPLRKRAEVQNAWLKERLETVLPEIMEREGFDMWIVTSRESNEDPVYFSLVPEPALYAKRRTILLFHLKDGELEKLNVYKSGFPGFYEAAWDPEKEEVVGDEEADGGAERHAVLRAGEDLDAVGFGSRTGQRALPRSPAVDHEYRPSSESKMACSIRVP